MIRYLQRKIDRSRAIIEQMLSLCSNPYLALSFGKDSLVMLDLVQEQCPEIPCLFLKSEESYLMYNYEEVINFYTERGLNLRIINTNRLSEHDFQWEKARKAGNKDFLLPEFFDGWDGVFMGLRIEESKARRMTIIRKEHNEIGFRIMQYKGGQRKDMYRACPMADWSGFEVMLYAQEGGLKLLDVYENGEDTRTTARLTGDAVRQNTLFWIQKTKPENWNRLIQMIPELQFFK